MKLETVVLFGATGLVGGYLLDELQHCPEVGKIICIGRKSPDNIHAKTQVRIASAEGFAAEVEQISPDAVFCCLGTTRAKAGSKAAFVKIDRDAPAAIAKAAAKSGVRTMVVISSIGANAQSGNFYLRTKGEMENEILNAGIEHVVIVRPSLLLGARQEVRFGEKIGEWLMKVAERFLTGKRKKYRSIHGRSVAVALLRLALKPQGKQIIESDQLAEIAKY
ncbi:MAG TPA: NAD(P)H-binding protein [Bacteroidales bacterium]|nr:NAD(P)H-binding protein [Bacteroidales bacterium]